MEQNVDELAGQESVTEQDGPGLAAQGAVAADPEPHPALPPLLVRSRLVATMPQRVVSSLVAAVEVMVQEGVTAFSFPPEQMQQVATLRPMYTGRAVFGIHDVGEAGQLGVALELEPAFVALRRPDDALVAGCVAAGVPVLVAALTPTEVQAAWREGVAAVLVVPAEVMGSSYPEALVPLCPDVVLMARGGLGAYSARRWAEAGAQALWLDDALLGDVVSGGSLGGLRERCQTFRAAVDPVDA